MWRVNLVQSSHERAVPGVFDFRTGGNRYSRWRDDARDRFGDALRCVEIHTVYPGRGIRPGDFVRRIRIRSGRTADGRACSGIDRQSLGDGVSALSCLARGHCGVAVSSFTSGKAYQSLGCGLACVVQSQSMGNHHRSVFFICPPCRKPDPSGAVDGGDLPHLRRRVIGHVVHDRPIARQHPQDRSSVASAQHLDGRSPFGVHCPNVGGCSLKKRYSTATGSANAEGYIRCLGSGSRRLRLWRAFALGNSLRNLSHAIEADVGLLPNGRFQMRHEMQVVLQQIWE